MAELNILEASHVSGKSIQTIRRMIKQKKIKAKRQKTPQGFNYLIDQDSLKDFLNEFQTHKPNISEVQNMMYGREHQKIEQPDWRNEFKGEFIKMNETIQKIVSEHARDKENLFTLLKTFQERNIILEQEVKALKEPDSSWWQFWK